MQKAVYGLAVATVLWPLYGGEANAQAGLLSGGAKELDPITLSSGQPLAKAPYDLESGGYYSLDINADGSAELALTGSEFFRAIWIDEVIINEIEVRPLGVDSLEFDDEGTATISFIAIKPGTYVLGIPNARGDTQKAVFNVK